MPDLALAVGLGCLTVVFITWAVGTRVCAITARVIRMRYKRRK